MSKIYEALRKAEQDREGLRSPAVGARPGERPVGGREGYQKLRASLLSYAGPGGLRTILITAPRHGDGATTVALGLTEALATDREARVLLVEANLRTPSLRHILPVTGGANLAEFAAGRIAADAMPVRLQDENFSVVAAGDGVGPGVDVGAVDALLSRIEAQYDFVVIDAAPVNVYADTSIVAAKVDAVVLVVEADGTPVAEAEEAKRQLDKVGARILGVVLNRRRSYIPAFLESAL